MLRKNLEGSREHCGPARSPLLGPGAAHLNQKTEIRRTAQSIPTSTHATRNTLQGA